MTQDHTSNNDSDAPINPATQKPKLRPTKKAPRWAATIPWHCDQYTPTLGEQGMWMAVITQAMMDALSRARDPEHRPHKMAATEWLTGNSKDFNFVCLLAGMDPNYVRRQAKKALVSPVEWRAAAGHGARYEERKRYRARIKKIKPSTLKEKKSAQILCGHWQ